MDEDRARKAFILLHWPLSLLILAPFVLRGAGAAWLATGIAVFAVVHLVLHLRLKDDPANEFSGALSYVPIWAAAVFGVLHCGTALT